MSVLSVQFDKRTEMEKDKKCLWIFSNSGAGGDGKFSVGVGDGKFLAMTIFLTGRQDGCYDLLLRR